MPGRHRDLGEAARVLAHGLGEAGGDGLARVVVLAVQEQDGQGELAAVHRLRGEVGVALPVHVPGIGAEESVGLERGRVLVRVLLRQHVGIHGEGRRLPRPAEPAALVAHDGGARRLSLALGVPLPEQGRDGVAHVGLEGRARLVEALLVEELIVPLPNRVLGLRVDRAIDQGDQGLRGEPFGEVRHAEVGHAEAALRMMAGEAPHDGAAPVVADPDRPVAAEGVEQLEHVLHALLERVVRVARYTLDRP